MLLPSKIISLLQVCIYLADASGVFVNHLDGGNHVQQAKRDEILDEPTASASQQALIRATVASKVLPEVRANNRFGSFEPNLYDESQSKNNLVLLDDPIAVSDGKTFAHAENGEQQPSSNSIDFPPMDFESYSVTISPTLMLNANDKDQEELEEKIEMHTNNHHTTLNSHHQPPAANVADKNNHNTRHYNTLKPAKHNHNNYLTPSTSSISKYHGYPSSFSSNLNLNYIHSLLLTKPSQAASSLTSLLHSLTTSGNPASSYSSAYHSSSPVSGLAAASSQVMLPQHPRLSGQQQSEQPQPQTQLQNTSALLDLSGGLSGATMCGRQQVAGSSREPRIVGGNNSYEGEFPWAVSIQRHGNHHCGGVIVGRRWILTAAHCVRSQLVGNLIVRTGGNTLARSPNHLGSHLERDYFVDQIVMHNDFSRYDNLTASQMKSSANTNNADIALLRLKHEIHWNELAWPVCFPSHQAGNFSGHDAVVIGWGKLNEKSEEFSNELQKVKLTIIDNKVCQNWFRQAGREMPIDDRVICAGFKNGGKDACHGDSGGPLLSKINGHYVVVGVVSTGIGCARPLLPGLYSRVSSYIGWIERNIT